MDNLVIIKSSKYGLTVHLDENVSYEELLDGIYQKFKDAEKFFRDAKMSITFEGRPLTKVQELQIINLISDAAHIHIVCIIDSNSKNEQIHKRIVDQSLGEIKEHDGQFYKGTLRRKQVLESDSSIVIIGDVESGATVAAKGNVIVIGGIFGTAHAGASGNKDAYIAALSMNPEHLRIADRRANMSAHIHDEEGYVMPVIATTDGKRIYIDPLT